jgi:hypothetical protein
MASASPKTTAAAISTTCVYINLTVVDFIGNDHSRKAVHESKVARSTERGFLTVPLRIVEVLQDSADDIECHEWDKPAQVDTLAVWTVMPGARPGTGPEEPPP